MRLAVTGSRQHGHERRVFEALDIIHAAEPVDVLISGHCPSTRYKPRSFDMICEDWAHARGIPVDEYPADWDNIDAMPCRIEINARGRPYNKLAGMNRNHRMLMLGVPHLLAVGPIRGPGTEHCRSLALSRTFEIPIIDIDL